jgi:hypothetical protein
VSGPIIRRAVSHRHEIRLSKERKAKPTLITGDPKLRQTDRATAASVGKSSAFLSNPPLWLRILIRAFGLLATTPATKFACPASASSLPSGAPPAFAESRTSGVSGTQAPPTGRWPCSGATVRTSSGLLPHGLPSEPH